MQIVVAPDKYAGTLTAAQAAAALREGWLLGAPHDTVAAVPLSDGGPGFLDVIAAALPAASLLPVTVTDPAGREVPAVVAVDGATAYVESAQACGLHLVTAADDLAARSTAGVGQLLRAALDTGATRVVVGLGGSGTYDAGRGAYEELGGWPDGVELVAASDVDVPLGDARWFAAQKGATPEQTEELAARTEAYADELEGRLGRRVRNRDGAGAAGGLGFALLALGGTRVPGIGLVADVTGLRDVIEESDLVVTGEGTYDATSLRGKVCGGVARLAQQAGRACLVLAGVVEVGAREARSHGIDELRSAADAAGSPEAARERPEFWLAAVAENAAKQWSRPA